MRTASRPALQRNRRIVPPIIEERSGLDIVIIGLTITSSWGNGHATTYRGLVRELVRRGHNVLFLEHDKPWYAENRDLAAPPYGRTRLYRSISELKRKFSGAVRRADLVIVGSFVPEGIAVGQWATETARGATAFYDIDTPVTLAKLGRDECEYLNLDLLRQYDLYLSFTGGPTLTQLKRMGARRPLPLYCSVDPLLYRPIKRPIRWTMGYLGTYSPDRQPSLNRMLIETARRHDGAFVVAGPQYPGDIPWPENVQRIPHLPPSRHRWFYNSQAFTLNITRADMIAAGWSPSVRLFEAAACGVPIISDWWEGMEEFLEPHREVLVARGMRDVLEYLNSKDEAQRRLIGERARQRILSAHTAAHRAAELERYALASIK